MKEIFEIALRKLSGPVNEQSLEEWVHWLDIVCNEDNSTGGIPQQLITGSIIAMGQFLMDGNKLHPQAYSNVLKTTEAASEYVIFPSEESRANYFRCATQSYAFGGGEGCYSVPSLQKEGERSCAVGTGCSSGAGSLMSMGIESKIVFTTISKALIPWIRGEFDPVLNG